MAESTGYMNYAAWAGVALTVVGLMLLTKTMLYTRDAAGYAEKAVKEAENATAAAVLAARHTEEGVNVSRAIGQIQARAYVLVDSAEREVAKYPDQFSATITFANSGNTPAHKVAIRRSITLCDYPIPDDFEPIADSSTMDLYPTLLGPRAAMSATLSTPVPSELYDFLGIEKATVMMYGRLTYTDVFGQEQWTEFRLVWAVSSTGKGRIVPLEYGNHAS